MRTRLLSTALLLALANVGRAAPAAVDKPPKWEYAELTFRAVPDRPAGVDADGKQVPAVPGYLSARWISAAGEVEVKGWEELAAKLKAPELKKGSAAYKRIQILNHLGGEGWELTEPQAGPTSVMRDPGSPFGERPRGGGFGASTSPTTWLLKRRVP